MRKIFHFFRDNSGALGLLFLASVLARPLWDCYNIIRSFDAPNDAYAGSIYSYCLSLGCLAIPCGTLLALTAHYHGIKGHYAKWLLHNIFFSLGLLLFILTFALLLFLCLTPFSDLAPFLYKVRDAFPSWVFP